MKKKKREEETGDGYEQWGEDADYYRYQERTTPEQEAEFAFDDLEQAYEDGY